jgi:hypothetical protein
MILVSVNGSAVAWFPNFPRKGGPTPARRATSTLGCTTRSSRSAPRLDDAAPVSGIIVVGDADTAWRSNRDVPSCSWSAAATAAACSTWCSAASRPTASGTDVPARGRAAGDS